MKHPLSRLMPTLLGAALLIPPAAQAKPVELKGGVYSPKPGVLCDRKAGFCADSSGIAVALTKLYLGGRAEKKPMDMIRPGADGKDYFDPTRFVLSNRVSCDTKAGRCTVSKLDDKTDAAHTKALFGR